MIHNMSTAMVLCLPFSLPDATPIGDRYAIQTRDGITYYFFNLEPFDCHPADDRRAMLLRAAKLQVVSGVRQADIMAAFNISRPTLARAVKRYREHGEDAFFEPRRRRGRNRRRRPDGRQGGRTARFRDERQRLRSPPRHPADPPSTRTGAPASSPPPRLRSPQSRDAPQVATDHPYQRKTPNRRPQLIAPPAMPATSTLPWVARRATSSAARLPAPVC